MAGRKVDFFVRNTLKWHFFVMRQTGIKFRQKMSIGVLYRTLMEEFPKFSLKGVTVPQKRHVGVVLTDLCLTSLQVTGYVSRLR